MNQISLKDKQTNKCITFDIDKCLLPLEELSLLPNLTREEYSKYAYVGILLYNDLYFIFQVTHIINDDDVWTKYYTLDKNNLKKYLNVIDTGYFVKKDCQIRWIIKHGKIML